MASCTKINATSVPVVPIIRYMPILTDVSLLIRAFLARLSQLCLGVHNFEPIVYNHKLTRTNQKETTYRNRWPMY